MCKITYLYIKTVLKYLFVPKYLFVYHFLPISSLYRRTAIVFYRRTAISYWRTAGNNIKVWYSYSDLIFKIVLNSSSNDPQSMK